MISNKTFAGLLVLLLLVGLIGCESQSTDLPTDSMPSLDIPPEETQNTDSYWVAYQWHSLDGEGFEGPFPMESDTWMVDLLLCTDGTACLRDIHDGLYLMDDADLQLTWTQDEDGILHFSNDIYLNTIYHATLEEKELLFDYRGTILTMQQAALPEDAGKRFHPAELVGTWLMISEHAEKMESLVFKTFADAEHITLTADYECRDSASNLMDTYYEQPLKLLDTPLYKECSNQTWHVQIGTEPIFLVTLSDRNTLLVQHNTAEQTFRRMPERLTWWDVQAEELSDTGWIGPDDLYLFLAADGSFQLGYADSSDEIAIEAYGTWTLVNGGVLLLQGEDSRYIGAVSSYCYETKDGFFESYDMILHNGTDLHRLSFQGYG